MSLKLEILEVVKGLDADNGETVHMWVQQPKPRKFKVNLGKASAYELQTIINNVGGTLLLEMGEMVQNGSHALYFKTGSEIDVLEPPKPITSRPSVIPPSTSTAAQPQPATPKA